ncbi:MAG: sulfatase [Bacteroides sp.]|nr:sulfatase [Bacteroides sp.]
MKTKASLVSSAIGLIVSSTHAMAETKPNIVFFMVDDMGWQDTSLPFDTAATPLNYRFRTPNMERLAKSGTKFTSAYACAISSPSRCSLMTGMNQARHRVTNWTKNYNTPTDDPFTNGMTIPDWNYNGIQPVDTIPNSTYATMLPALLQKAGYGTIHVGKAHFGSFGTPSADPINMGFDINIAGSAAGGPPQGGYLGTNRYGHDKEGNPISSYAVPSLEKYWDTDVFLSEALTREALSAVDSMRNNNPDRPFFLYLSHYAVHVPFDADKRFEDHYRDLDKQESDYATLIEGMDKSLGDVLDYLEAHGLADNTIIVFMSDNGGLDFYARGATPDGIGSRHNFPLRSGKGSAYEGGIREPLIIRWPGVAEEGATNNTPVIIEDLYPTLLSMAQVDSVITVQQVDGSSIKPILSGDTAIIEEFSQRPLVWNTPNNWTNMIDDSTKRELGIGANCAIRVGNFKLIYFYGDQSVELYDLSADIGENHDISKSEPAITERLRKLLGETLRSMDAQRPNLPDGKPAPWPDE